MSVFSDHVTQCSCGAMVTAQLANSINVRRSPAVRDAILNGELHRARCTNCAREFTVEKPFIYMDFDKNAVFEVLPRGARYRWREASEDLDAAASVVPATLSEPKSQTLRVVFGMDELREKLVAQDNDIDDRKLELIKVLVINEHPFLLQSPRLRLTLHSVTETQVTFHVAYEHSSEKFEIDLPRSVADLGSARSLDFEAWTKRAHRDNLFANDEKWVNIWRWSPQPSALNDLKDYASRIRDGKSIKTSTNKFKRMLARLPRGNHLPTWAKKDLAVLFDYAKAKNKNKLQDTLFEIRFGFGLEDDWSTNNDEDDIDTLWKLLRDLPDNNVEGNTRIRNLLLNEGEGGGWYSPSTHDIGIGELELGDRERFEDVVRHEVGHAVHEMREGLVNGWLENRFGWRILGTSDQDIDAWIGLMGGWGNSTLREEREIRNALRTALGNGGSWSPGPVPRLPFRHVWHSADFGPRLAFENTGANWFRNFRTWHRSGGNAFFLNYWYRAFMVVSEDCLDLVAHMPSSYASMSHYEFFAELYALHYDLDDPQRGAIPSDVALWMDNNIGDSAPSRPIRPQARRRRYEWEGIVRPDNAKSKKSKSGKKRK